MRASLPCTLLLVLIAGCGRSDDKEAAALRKELANANAQIKDLQAKIDLHPKAGPDRPAKAKGRLVVVRGLRPNWDYPIFEGHNFIGRADEKPVDIDLEPQEPPDRVWSSRQHALITCTAGSMVIEDLNSANGTYVNRKRVPPGEKLMLVKDDIIQVGAVQMRVSE